MMELTGYVILLVQTIDDEMKLYGSPANSSELEIGDEIMSINGKNLTNCSHLDIINHIHKVIFVKSYRIIFLFYILCIKSRSISLRVKRKKDLNNLNDRSKVKEAYVIAVEDEAQQRLEKLSLLHKVQAVDMTKLASDISENSSIDSENCVELNPVNQTTVSVQTHTPNVFNGCIEMTELGSMEMEATKKPKTEKRKKNASNQNSDQDSPVLEAIQNSVFNANESFSDSMQDSFDQDDSTHREMAIDCPENFIASVKIPPKYPPSYQNSTESLKTPPTTPSKGFHQNEDKNMTDSTLKSASVIMSNGRQNHPINKEQLERLHKHQDDLRKRREEENRLAREDEFLRTSLRGSKKLQVLKERKQLEPQGVINTAYDNSVDDLDNLDDGFSSVHGPFEKERYMKKNVGLDDLFSSLQHIKTQLNSTDDKSQISIIQHLFNNNQFRKAVQVHNKIIQVTSRSAVYSPDGSNALQTSNEVMTVLQHTPSPYASDLTDLLSIPGFKNLLRAHDGVADHQSKPSNLGDEDFSEDPISNYGEDTIKIIHLEKTNEPLGATVRNEGDAVVIGRIVKGGTAEKSGLLHEGDEILEVNGIDMKGKNINDVSEMLANMSGTVTFMIIPSGDFKPKISSDEVVNVKALFNYDPEEDIYIPCRELGISFMKGDILRVINREDLNWWQAYREGEDEHELAGLIPSSNFLEQREAYKRTLNNDGKDNTKKGKSCSCGRRDRRKKKKQMYKDGLEETEEVLTYEEVSLYYPQPNRKRPVVLIGPAHVGRHELRQRLMESDFDRFAAAIPHTSRPRKENEVPDRDYHFVTAVEFKLDIENNKFIEHGEFEKNLYGTSLNAVRQVINQGKICILNLHPESMRLLKESDLKPYIVFVYPPNMEKLRQIQQHLTNGIKVKDEELQDSIERAREMEDKYGHYFDYILVNSDMELAYQELVNEINRLEVEPQWVPSSWVGSRLVLQ
ncbi:MPP5 [Mytilus coruscus]|uniref:MPP5 n=1 Tax=Mytilus coruscus TaxID=42192 RepID=A0A6J8D3U6_MYTCO|nr:MPP5 [Mytilus coruscus]